jgi:hypothetical protein
VTFQAGNTSGIAEVRATSGGATGGTTTTGTGTRRHATTNNVILITIGAAAVNTVTLRANPGSVRFERWHRGAHRLRRGGERARP